MDILDIDEALKDDSFIFLEDKTHDDVSNILQQWRNNNNCCPSSHNSEQAFKLNTRTFTRPKRKTAQNLEAQYSPVPQSQNAGTLFQQQQNVNLEIGGLVTTMQKSFLQDTSPPSSICSSMDVSMNGMNGSLITSADFTNINFLQSTRGDEPMSGLFFDTEKATEDGYTLSDMIRDRKVLESLTLSGEGTLIKDSNIAQIDDMSLINSKTTSACSTMNNSMDSMGGGCSETFSSQTCNIAEQENHVDLEILSEKLPEKKPILNETFPSGKEQIVPNSDEDFIGNTTFNLVDSSIMFVPQPQDEDKSTKTVAATNVVHNETFRKPILEETICLKRFNVAEVANTTFDCSETKIQCETPENAAKHGKHYEQSTPQQNTSYVSSVRHKQSYTPSIKAAEVNISPIVGPAVNRTLNETFEKSHNHVATNILKERVNNETYCESQPAPRVPPCSLDPDYEAEVNLAFETMELLENIKPNETFNKSLLGRTPSVDASDEEAFDNLLDKFGKLELNEEQKKMRKSLDTIKKRFTYGVMDKPEAKENSLISSSEMVSSGLSMNSSGGGDRLLSRRSRLYDDLNLSKPLKSSPSSSTNSISFVKETDSGGGGGREPETIHKKTDEKHCTTALTESNEFTPLEERAARNSKLEKRDRDRFKTIRIFKRQEDGENELNVPCIDGVGVQHESEHLPSTQEEEAATTPQDDVLTSERVSRRDYTPQMEFNNNKAEVESNNYATFKKPKEKVRKFGGFGAGPTNDQLNRPVIPAVEKPTEQRSLSRPRYLSGLQKFSASGKAISAGDLEKTAQQNTKNGSGGACENFNETQPLPAKTDLKSPMGIKSKSFHNLSSNFGYSAPKSAPALTIGVRKSTTAGNVLTEKQGKLNTTRTNTRMSAVAAPTNMKQPNSKAEKSDDAVFKTPSLVSGLRAPSAKRTGLIRPSSGYYSFSVAKSEGLMNNTTDLDAGRHSPTDSMSSASSRGSSTGKPITNGVNSTQPAESSLMPPPSLSSHQQTVATPKSIGIPKPSGLRPPSNIKRSGLPRPASIVRR